MRETRGHATVNCQRCCSRHRRNGSPGRRFFLTWRESFCRRCAHPHVLQGTAPLTLTTTWSLPVFPFVIATRTGDDEVSWEPGTGGSAVLARQRQGEVRVPALRCAVCRECVCTIIFHCARVCSLLPFPLCISLHLFSSNNFFYC
jgi:hypothetical protein